MMKKMKRVTTQSPPSYTVDEETKNRYKLQGLMQDFDELHRETEGLKQKLQKTKRKKLTLLTEVRFLRRRYKHLLKSSSQVSPAENFAQPQNPEMSKGATYVKEKKHKEKEAVKRNPPTMLDLNEVSNPREEEETETREFQVAWEPLRMDKKLKRCTVEGEALTMDLSTSICRDVGTGSNRSGKRKITWQDQVALRV